MTALRIGQLELELTADRPTRCGIHGDVIEDHRCATCDGRRCSGKCRELFHGPPNPEMPPGPKVHGRCWIPKEERRGEQMP